MHGPMYIKKHFSFMNVILIQRDHLHVSAAHVAIFRMVSERIQCDGITTRLQSIILVQIRLNCKTGISIKYWMLRTTPLLTSPYLSTQFIPSMYIAPQYQTPDNHF